MILVWAGGLLFTPAISKVWRHQELQRNATCRPVVVLIELQSMHMQLTKAEHVYATRGLVKRYLWFAKRLSLLGERVLLDGESRAFMKAVVLYSPTVHILASIATHASTVSEFINLSMQSPTMLAISAIPNLLQRLRLGRYHRACPLRLSLVALSCVRNQASRGQVRVWLCQSERNLCVCSLESRGGPWQFTTAEHGHALPRVAKG